MNVDELKATLQQGNQAAKAGKETLQRAAVTAAEAQSLAQATIDDSRDKDAVAGLKLLDEVASEIGRTATRFDAAEKRAEEYAKGLG